MEKYQEKYQAVYSTSADIETWKKERNKQIKMQGKKDICQNLNKILEC